MLTTEEPALTFTFPQLYIIVAAQSDEEPRATAVYPLETAPIPVFNIWLKGIVAAEESTGDPLFLMVVKGHRDSWDTIARWWLINALALHGVDMTKYYFESREEAEKAMEAREGQ
jgi:hypothetical protein